MSLDTEDERRDAEERARDRRADPIEELRLHATTESIDDDRSKEERCRHDRSRVACPRTTTIHAKRELADSVEDEDRRANDDRRDGRERTGGRGEEHRSAEERRRPERGEVS